MINYEIVPHSRSKDSCPPAWWVDCPLSTHSGNPLGLAPWRGDLRLTRLRGETAQEGMRNVLIWKPFNTYFRTILFHNIYVVAISFITLFLMNEFFPGFVILVLFLWNLATNGVLLRSNAMRKRVKCSFA